MLYPNNTIKADSTYLISTGGLDFSYLKSPAYYVSVKRDGIRCEVGGKLRTRELTAFNNQHLEEYFSDLLTVTEGTGVLLEGELYSDKVPFDELSGIIRSKDKALPDDLTFYAFDYLEPKEDYITTPFRQRYERLKLISASHYEPVKQYNMARECIQYFFSKTLGMGFEGLILREPEAGYKHGRVTLNENIAFKMKKLNTFDVTVIDILEGMTNTEESFMDAKGKLKKHKRKENLVPNGMAGAFVIQYKDKVQKTGIAMTEDVKREIWANKELYINRKLELSGMESSKDGIRHPVFIRWRE